MIILSRGASSLLPTTGQCSWAEDDCSVFAGQCGAEDAIPPLPFSQASLWGPTSYSVDPSDRSLTNLCPQAAHSDQVDSSGPGSKSCGRQSMASTLKLGQTPERGVPLLSELPAEFREMGRSAALL